MSTISSVINKQIQTIQNNNITPKYISFNIAGYKRFMYEEKMNSFPEIYMGLPIIVNLHQHYYDVLVLASPRDEFLYTTNTN